MTRINTLNEACTQAIGYILTQKQAEVLARKYTAQAYYNYLLGLAMSNQDWKLDKHIEWLDSILG